MPHKSDRHVIVGRIGRPFGVKGWSHVESFTHPATNILTYFPWKIGLEGVWHEVKIEKNKIQDNKIVVKLLGCDDRDKAKKFTNYLIAVPREVLPEVTLGEYYWTDLEGLKVVDKNGMYLGIIDHVFATGANDVLVVKNKDATVKNREILIPFIASVILKVDLVEETVNVDWDEV